MLIRSVTVNAMLTIWFWAMITSSASRRSTRSAAPMVLPLRNLPLFQKRPLLTSNQSTPRWTSMPSPSSPWVWTTARSWSDTPVQSLAHWRAPHDQSSDGTETRWRSLTIQSTKSPGVKVSYHKNWFIFKDIFSPGQTLKECFIFFLINYWTY